MLAKLGYRFDPNELEDWEVESYCIIANTIAKEEEKEMKKASKSRKR